MRHTYDDPVFFAEYAKMARSRQGLCGAGEWHQFQKLFPELTGKRVLDLGCGYGWHSKYAAEQGASEVLGIDLSKRMIDEARRRNPDSRVTYTVQGLEAYTYPPEAWDCVISNLVLHYIADLDTVFRDIFRTLRSGGVFLLNMEHPVFTAGVGQDWIFDGQGRPLYWPVDGYFMPGPRTTHFLGREVEKQHHTLTQILMGLLNTGFRLDAVEEAVPPAEMMDLPGMADELRSPMMLLIKAVKPGCA